MSTSKDNIARLFRRKHLTCGAGGSRAILGSAGGIVACHLAGLNDWETMGGISGGSIPTVLLAAGGSPVDMMRMAIDIDFAKLVPSHATPLRLVIAFLLKNRFEYTRPHKGVLGSELLGKWIDERIPVWPKKFWTMAVVGRTQIVFTADGVFQYLADGSMRKIADQPPPVGLAIRATCAVPGIIDAVPYNGRWLFDGALSWDGLCPVGLVQRHFGADPNEIVALDVGDEPSRWSTLVTWFWKLVCGGHCVPPDNTVNFTGSGVLMMEPHVTSVRSLQFTLTTEDKWEAVLAGFQEAVGEMAAAGVLSGTKLDELLAISQNVELLKAL